MSTHEHKIIINPAFDKRNDNPEINYGIHGASMCFYVIGDEGIVQFVLYTNWQLPHVQEEMDRKPNNPDFPYMLHKPMPADIGYHSHVPLYEGQEPMDSCQFMSPCYYDGSTLNAERFFRILLEEGSDGLWNALENQYQETFEPVMTHVKA